MKIIKKGENWCAPTFTEVMVECDRCESKLEIEAEDVREGCHGMFFECPVCFKCNMLKGDVKERYLNWVEYKNKKQFKELKEETTELEKKNDELDAKIREIGYWAKQCQ